MDRADLTNSLYWVAARCLADHFPPTSQALDDPDGLLAIGGGLDTARLLDAYSHGIFPWYCTGQPILWWSPDPRSVLAPHEVHVSRSLAKTRRQGGFEYSFDRAFEAVVDGCAAPRAGAEGTWITPEMRAAYIRLHRGGYAHSVECWRDGELCGGLYGVALGRVFFGESMFTRARDASKLAFVELCANLQRWDYALIDCQVHNPHLARLGAYTIARTRFEAILARQIKVAPAVTAWHTSDAA